MAKYTVGHIDEDGCWCVRQNDVNFLVVREECEPSGSVTERKVCEHVAAALQLVDDFGGNADAIRKVVEEAKAWREWLGSPPYVPSGSCTRRLYDAVGNLPKPTPPKPTREQVEAWLDAQSGKGVWKGECFTTAQLAEAAREYMNTGNGSK